MSNLKKTIQINPELFKIQSSTKSRTKNNREKSKKTITPSFLKKQLIDRIKSHKNKLESSLEPSREKEKEKESIQTNNNNDDDEFILSMNFLSTLSEEKKSTPTKTTFIDNITPSNPNPVHIDLPIELLENNNVFNEIPSNKIPSNEISSNKIPSNEILSNEILSNDISLDEFPSNETHVDEIPIKQSVKYTHPNDVPYGCLKNGNKPTYRSWMNKTTINNKSTHNETLKNYTNSNNNLSLDREKKLNELKNKFCREKEKEKEKTFIKRTIKKKYTLGKSDIKRKVGILIKNINTRKKVTDSHKELKTHQIDDIKKYLRNRGLIRIGNTTPHDVLRKIYESSILSGDITNNNKDILLHNLLNDN
jgi:hypothetical protein